MPKLGKVGLYCFCFCFVFLQDVDKWTFDVFALHEASSEHALKFMVYELLTRYDLINRFRVRPQNTFFLSVFLKLSSTVH